MTTVLLHLDCTKRQRHCVSDTGVYYVSLRFTIASVTQNSTLICPHRYEHPNICHSLRICGSCKIIILDNCQDELCNVCLTQRDLCNQKMRSIPKDCWCFLVNAKSISNVVWVSAVSSREMHHSWLPLAWIHVCSGSHSLMCVQIQRVSVATSCEWSFIRQPCVCASSLEPRRRVWVWD